MNRWRAWCPSDTALLAIALLAFVLDTAGATWGLPARWHPDEKADAAARMVREGDFAPDSFINPTLSVYAMVPAIWAQDLAAGVGLLRGRAADPLMAGRILAALAGAVAVYLCGLVGGHLSRRIGRAAAAFLALAPGVVNLCHFATPEAWLILATSATLLACMRYVTGGTSAWVVGLVLGLAASTKYTAAALVVPCVLAVWLARREARRGDIPAMIDAGVVALIAGVVLLSGTGADLAAGLRLEDARLLRPERAAAFVTRAGAILAGAGVLALAIAVAAAMGVARARDLARADLVRTAAAAVGGFVLGTPYALVEPRRFLSDLAFNDQTRFEYKGLTGEATSFGAYLDLAASGLTMPLLAAMAAGLVVAAARSVQRDRLCPVLIAGAIAPYLLVAASGHQALRFLAPVFPAATILGALGLMSIPRDFARHGAIGIVIARSALASVLVVRLFFVDSRAAAARWLEANVPAGETIDLIANNAGYAPAPAGRPVRIVPTLSREMAPADRFAEAAARYPAEASRFLVLTASFHERFLDHPGQHPERSRFFADLLAGRGGFETVARFRQQGWRRPDVEFVDPEIVILRRKDQVPTS